MKKARSLIYTTFIVAIFSLNIMAKPLLRDPIKLNIAVSPSTIESNHSAVLNFSQININATYKVTCNVTAIFSNDPIYFIESTSTPRMCIHSHYSCGETFVDGIRNTAWPYKAVLPSAGAHTIGFYYYLSNSESTDTLKKITVHNASNDIINFTNCYAEVS